jgi:hypothetical protein
MQNNCNIFLLIPYLISGFVGAGVALIELATRFSDDIKSLFKNYASYIYLFINFFSSIIIFTLLCNADISIFDMKIIDHPYISSIVIGLLSMGLLRSSFLNIQIRNKNIDTGLSKTIDMLLHWVESIYDRNKSSFLIKEVIPIVKNIKFEVMYKAIIPTCMAAFSNLDLNDNNEINEVMKKLYDENNLPDNVKVNQLAIEAAKKIGVKILKDCVDIYKESSEKLNTGYSRNLEMLDLLKKRIIEDKINLEEVEK